MFKKILSVITACALLCLCFTVFVSAGSSTCSASMTYELDNSGVLLVTVTFTDIDDESGVVAVSSNVRFDSEILEYVGFEQDYPKEWGDYGDSWTCLAENDPSLIKLTYLFDSAEEGHGAQGDFSTVLKFNVLRTGVETVITATENSVTNDLLMIIPAPDVTLTLTVTLTAMSAWARLPSRRAMIPAKAKKKASPKLPAHRKRPATLPYRRHPAAQSKTAEL